MSITIKVIEQNKMTSECWMVQFNGLQACESCEFKGKKDCGGKKIRKTGKNEKGFDVPIG